MPANNSQYVFGSDEDDLVLMGEQSLTDRLTDQKNN